jgi:hypothetical protein
MLMPDIRSDGAARRNPFGRRNVVLLAAAVVSLVAGYALLQAGSPSLAAVLLVLGYCILFPLAIAL